MQISAILENSIVFSRLDKTILAKTAKKTRLRTVEKGEYIFREQEECDHFLMVAKGLVKVYVTSSSGARMTYLIAREGEPLNLIAPFDASPRPTVARAMGDAVIAQMPKEDFLNAALSSPQIMSTVVAILGRAIDSANSRIIDMMEKKVDERLFRALFSLYRKFGSPLNFTSHELAGLVGTTTESILRSMGRLKKQSIIDSSRGRVEIKDPKALEKYGIDSLWI